MKIRSRSLAACVAVAAVFGAAALAATVESRADDVAPLPHHLAATGLYVAGSATEIRPENASFSPQYPLWSDGATKRRWLYVPPGTAIDATRPDAWDFPRGTKLWKEFSVAGRRVETRFVERLADGTWRFAVYAWNEAGTDAVLAPAGGIAALAVAGAPNGRYAIPSEIDCRACHEGAPVPVLGASALQLSPDRDPLAPHADTVAGGLDLRGLVARGWLRNLDPALLATPPRIAASTPQERAALGYLHGNCGHCHNDGGSPAPVGLVLAEGAADARSSRQRVLASTLETVGRFRPADQRADARLIAPGVADASVLVLRMRTRNPMRQMPPVGTQLADAEGLALIERWINHLPTRKETQQ